MRCHEVLSAMRRHERAIKMQCATRCVDVPWLAHGSVMHGRQSEWESNYNVHDKIHRTTKEIPNHCLGSIMAVHIIIAAPWQPHCSPMACSYQ